MAMSLTIAGRVMRQPEMRYINDGTAVTNITLAVPYGWKREGEQYRPTMWVRVSFWGRKAEVVNENVHEGDNLWVEGKLDPDRDTGNPKTYTANDGTFRASYDVRANEFEWMAGGAGNSSPKAPADEAAVKTQEADDIPF